MRDFRFKEVSIVPQYAMSALNPTRRVGKMVAELLKSRGFDYKSALPELERRVKLVGLDADILKRYPIELSGGMKQRVVMVISTLLNPSLLIADEVTSALDVSTQRAVGEMLLEFRDRKFVKTMMVITHDVSILAQVADTILVMYAGKLAEKASADVVINSPLHPYTQLLISSLPEVGVRHDEHTLVGIPGRPPPLLNPPAGCRFRDRCPVRLRPLRRASRRSWRSSRAIRWRAGFMRTAPRRREAPSRAEDSTMSPRSSRPVPSAAARCRPYAARASRSAPAR